MLKLAVKYISTNTKAQIYSSAGQMLNCSIAVTSKSIKADISNLPAGLYYLQVHENSAG